MVKASTIQEAAEELNYGKRKTILFIDEIHRFNKAQQDAFLPHVEKGTIILIGATTENPSFEVISPLLSRTKVFTLHPPGEPEIEAILRRALRDEERGLGGYGAEVEPEVIRGILRVANGDARAALNTLEMVAMEKPVALAISSNLGGMALLPARINKVGKENRKRFLSL